MTAPPLLNLHAVLVLDVNYHAADLPGSWFITHGMGKPAAGTYTEVVFGGNALIDPEGQPWPEHVLDQAVRRVAEDLYGRSWAFHYRPDQYADAIGRYGMRRRERVVITNLEVWA